MNKIITLATSSICILIMQSFVLQSKPAVARSYKLTATKLAEASNDEASSSKNDDFTVQDELEEEASYNDSADTELFFEEGASADDESTSNEVDNSETDNSEDNDVTVQDELEQEAPYNDSADTELFYEDGASANDKAEDSKINRDRTKSDDEKIDSELETDDENTNPPQGLNNEDIKVDSELETEADTFEQQDSTDKPRIEDVRQPDIGEDNLPAEPPVNEAEVEF